MASRPQDPPPTSRKATSRSASADLVALGRRLVESAESLREIGLALAAGQIVSTTATRASDDPADALKRYLPDERFRIQLQDLIDSETRRVVAKLQSDDLGMGAAFSPEEARRRLETYEQATRPLAILLALGGYWGSPTQASIWIRAIQGVANAVPGGNGLQVWLRLRHVPALLLLSAVGMSSVAAGRLAVTARVLREPKVREPIATQPAALVLVSNQIINTELANAAIDSLKRHYTPGSDYVHEWLRPLMAELVPDDEEYSDLFDRWEFMQGLAYIDLSESERGWAPVGRVAWRSRYERGPNLGTEYLRDLSEQGAEWPPLQVGMFGRNPETATTAIQKYAEHVEAARSRVF